MKNTSQTASPQAQEPIIIGEVKNGIGWLTLNREKALNSLNDQMIHGIHRFLVEWEKAPEVHAVVLQGKGRAFCAGGDVRNFYYNKKAGEIEKTEDFFRKEYLLNGYIHAYPKPYISLINGINMGGGMGISIHGSHRVVTENATLAMPETTIGFHTDVGGSYFLSRLPDYLGIYLGLTGIHISGADAFYAGLVTHYAPSHKLDDLAQSFQTVDWSEGHPQSLIDDLLEEFSLAPPPSSLEQHRDVILECFSHSTVEEILQALKNNTSAFAQTTYKDLLTKSPSSLKVVLKALIQAKHMDFSQCLLQELRLSHAFIKYHDFAEGVRALLIDKDKTPVWNPGALEEVTPDIVEAHFMPLEDEERFYS